MSHLNLPIPIGSRSRFSPAQLAERAIERVAEFERFNTRKRPQGGRYGFFMDHKGRAWLDRPPNALCSQWLITFTRKTDPDDIADEIWDAE